MHGTPETVAKTLCLALLKIAVRENRKCYLISFSTDIQTLNLNDYKIIHFLSMSFQGGTDATPAMQEALRMLTTEDYKKADIIMVSDFVMPAFDEQTQSQIKTAKENKTKFHNLVIGSSENTAAMKEFDNNWFYDINKPDSLLTLVKNIRGI
ncbi:VWA domain protein interacting with AAA ATPase [Bacteroidales bacterium Barb6XT]|nr:VWA domain protein interacting with AAA ATPase [Bacteroidales bacterium Barb6XT]